MKNETIRQVQVEDMLAARDARAARQRAWLSQAGVPLVCLTMNIAGPVKVTPWIRAGFAEAVERVDAQLLRHGMRVKRTERFAAHTGHEAMWAVEAEALPIKRAMTAIEEDGRFGRLLDIDVIGLDGNKIDRSAIGHAPRACLLCGREATLCARSRTHPVEALFAETEAILRKTLCGQVADRVAALAQRALLHEVAATPKPGLVDRANNGAHRDMDFLTFLDSAAVLSPYFAACVKLGMEEDDLQHVFPRLRYPGMCVETEMLAVTGGVNTHKGAIFSLGILCAAVGYAVAHGLATDAEALCLLCGEMTREHLALEMQGMAGFKGARGEVAEGFPAVRLHGLPALEKRLAAGDGLNDAGVYALIAIMADTADANVARRGGAARAHALMAEARALLADYSIDKVKIMDIALIRENLSPGGCADLLAVTYCLHFLSACSSQWKGNLP